MAWDDDTGKVLGARRRVVQGRQGLKAEESHNHKYCDSPSRDYPAQRANIRAGVLLFWHDDTRIVALQQLGSSGHPGRRQGAWLPCIFPAAIFGQPHPA
jgi:hypothetical protein